MAQDEGLGRFRREPEPPEIVHPPPKPRFPHDVPIATAIVSSDHKVLVALDARGSLVGWDVATARRRYRLPALGNEAVPHRLTGSPDGRFVALSPRGLPAGAIRVHELPTGKELRRFHGFSPAFSPDGETLAATDGKHLRRWSMKSGAELPSLEECGIDLKWAAYSPQGDLLAASGETSTEVVVWNVALRRRISFDIASIRGEAAASLAFSSSGKTLAVGSHWGIRFWDLGVAPPCERELRAHEEYALGPLTFSTEGRRMAALIRRRRLLVWDPVTGEPQFTWSAFQAEHRALEVCDGADLAIWIDRDGVRLERIPRILAGADDGHVIRSVCFTSAGQVVTGDDRGTIRVWDPATQKEVRRIAVPLQRLVFFSKDGTWVVFGGGREPVRIWDLAAGREVMKAESESFVGTIALSPDSSTMALGHSDGSISLWDLGQQRQRARVPLEMGSVRAISWSADGKSLAWGDEAGGVVIAEGTRGLEPLRFKPRRDAAVRRLSFSEDGRFVIATDALGTHRRYAGELGVEPVTIAIGREHLDDRWNGSGFLQRSWPATSELVYSSDALYAATVTETGQLLIWQAPGGK